MTTRKADVMKWSVGPEVGITGNGTILSQFEDQALQTPLGVAIVEGPRTVTYEWVNDQAELLMHSLRRQIGDEKPVERLKSHFVACLLPPSVDYLVAQIGVWKAGFIFCPLDVNNPSSRLTGILEDLGNPILISTGTIWKEMLKDYSKVLDVEAHTASTTTPSVSGLGTRVANTQVALCLFTSGSTGQPKGVYIKHTSLANYVHFFSNEHEISAKDRSAFYSNPSFDMAVTQTWPFLTRGGTVVVPPPNLRRNLPLLLNWVKVDLISFLMLPSIVGQFFLDKTECHNLRWLVFAGERLSFLDGYMLSSDLPFRVGQNYGLTEGTLGQTSIVYAPGSTLSLSVGRPIQNNQVWVLDPNMNPCLVDCPGEIYLGGAGICELGYHNRPLETSKAYVASPFNPAQLLCRTRDRGIWREDGTLEVVGRCDNQVKIAGCRLELGEVEVILSKHPFVAECVVLFNKGPPEQLTAVVSTLLHSNTLTIGSVAQFLRDLLPPYAIPTRLHVLPALPLTSNGKVDRALLLSLEEEKGQLPSSAKELEMAGLWAKVLNISREAISLSTTFYQLGGNSLKTAELLHELQAEPWRAHVTFTQLFENPSLQEFTQFVSQSEGPASAKNLSAEALNLEVKKAIALIDFNGLPEIKLDSFKSGDHEILLTGATGYLGSHLLHQLVVQTNSQVHCLIRAVTHQKALARLVRTLQENGLFLEAEAWARVHCVAGDFSKERLGLPRDKYAELAERIGLVVHCGADVHHFRPYADLVGPNVDGTRHVIQFGLEKRLKHLHHISTAVVCEQFDAVWKEEPLVAKGPVCRSGYSQSKWVSEQIAWVAGSRGLPVSVYRLGDIGPNSSSSHFNNMDLFSKVIKTFLSTNLFINDVEWPLFALADTCAEALVSLFLESGERGKIYHVGTRLDEAMITTLKALGIKSCSLQQWLELNLHSDEILEVPEHVFITREWFRNRYEDFKHNFEQFRHYLNFSWSTQNTETALKAKKDKLCLHMQDIQRFASILNGALLQVSE